MNKPKFKEGQQVWFIPTNGEEVKEGKIVGFDRVPLCGSGLVYTIDYGGADSCALVPEMLVSAVPLKEEEIEDRRTDWRLLEESYKLKHMKAKLGKMKTDIADMKKSIKKLKKTIGWSEKMRVIFCLFCVVLFTGCASNLTVEEQHSRVHVIDACYTVLETNPVDKQDRINSYLESHKQEGNLSGKEVFIIKECLKRTEESDEWRANKSFWTRRKRK